MEKTSSYSKKELSEAKRKLLEQRLQGRFSALNEKENLIQKSGSTKADLSPMQKRIWLHEQINDQSAIYNLTSTILIKGDLNVEVLEASLNSVMKKQSSLRTCFITENDQPQQVVANEQSIQITKLNLEHEHDQVTQEKAVKEIVEMESGKAFDLTTSPLLRATLIRLKNEKHIFIVTKHHLISDGWSMGVFVQELNRFYNILVKNEESPELTLPVEYIDYCLWDKQRSINNSGIEFWKKQLAQTPVLQLPTDFQRPNRQTVAGGREYFKISQDVVAQAKELCKATNVTLYNLFLSAFQVVLYKYTGQKDFAIGTPTANRNHHQTQNIIGCFINTLVLRSQIDDRLPVKDFIKNVQQGTLRAFQYQDVSLDQVLEHVDYQRDPSYSPLFQVMFAFQNTPWPTLSFENLEIERLDVAVQYSMFDLTLSLEEQEDQIGGFIEYKSDLFSQETIKKLITHLEITVEEMIERQDDHLQQINLLRQSEMIELINFEYDLQENKTFVQLFEEHVRLYPQKTALVCENSTLSYEHLNQKANQLARSLLKQGYSKETLVGIYLNRSMEALIGILGVLKAGFCYVPLDPSYPEERVQYMIQDSGLSLVLTSTQLKKEIRKLSSAFQLILLDDWSEMEEEAIEDLELPVDLDQLAYIIYTSGSTGEPKGVMVEHKGMYNVVKQQEKIFQVTEQSRVLQFASLSFDASVFEIIMALGNGGTLFLEPKENLLGSGLTQYIEQHGITHVTLPPSVLSTLPYAELPTLEVIITAGERCTDEIINKWAVNRRFFNAYGPTEATIWSTTAECFPDRKITIGKAVGNVELYILDEQQQLVPRGVHGELYIGGISLARGYLKREELTQESFIPHPFSKQPGQKLYKTGDLVRYNSIGDLEFLGRKDEQIKIRGFRIELGEIQSQLVKMEAVQAAAVTVLEAEGNLLLAAYVIGDEVLTIKEIKKELSKHLPDYMVPSIIKIVSAFPVTPNGKIDYKKLIEETELIGMNDDEDLIAPQTEIQLTLCKLWAEILKLDQVGINQDFFNLGGHSLSATQLSNRIEREFNINFPTKLVFEHPTIEDMEREILGSSKKEAKDILITRAPRTEKMPLSFSQQRLWFIEQMEMGGSVYNIPACVRLKGSLNTEALKQSIATLVQRHEVFRISFSSEEGLPYQYLGNEVDVTVTDVYLHGLDTDAKEEKILELAKLEAEAAFKLDQPPLLRVTLIHADENEHILLFTMHHIISDGWSVDIFIKELGTLYHSFILNEEVHLPKNDLQYLDYVYWQQDFVKEGGLDQQLDYWRKQLEGDLPVIELPTDRDRPSIQTFNGEKELLILDPDLKVKVDRLNRTQGTTLFMTLLTAFNIFLYRITGHTDIAVGTPIAGRNNKDTEEMIGFFINTLVLRSNLSSNPNIEQLLQDAKKMCLAAYENQDVPFERLVEELQPSRNLSHNPLVQVMLNVQNQQKSAIDLPNLTIEQLPIEGQGSKFDLTLYVEEVEETIQLELVYNSDLFSRERMQESLLQLKLIIEAMVGDTKQHINSISLQTELFRNRLLSSRTSVQTLKYAHDELLHKKVTRSAIKYPTSTAISDKNKNWTYAEIEHISNRIANYLRAKGISKGQSIALYASRDASLVYSMLGILKAGAVFCILDPTYPVERIRRSIQVLKPEGIILLAEEQDEQKKAALSANKFMMDHSALMQEIQAYSDQFVPDDLTSEDLAYITFTSGSTGEPNAIRGAHAAVAHFINWHVGEHQLNVTDRFSMFSGLAHDPLLRDIFTPLSLGATLCIPSDDTVLSPDTLIEWAQNNKVSVMHLTPSHLMMMTEIPELENSLADVRYFFFGGEALLSKHVSRVNQVSPQSQIVNFYGATETPQAMASYRVKMDKDKIKSRLPIGLGIDGVQLKVMNTDNIVEAGLGEIGEIYVHTPFLSKGYVNNKEVEEERFIHQNVDGIEEKVYKTGDLGRYLINGLIEIIARKDKQTNIRGFRVELGEIESALVQHPNISNAICLVDESQGRELLVAYYVTNQAEPISLEQLKNHMATHVPNYMIPVFFIQINGIPLTPNGKVDVKALPKPPFTTKSVLEPTNQTERMLRDIWEELLEIKNVSLTDNFFDLGGHSLLLAQLRNRIIKELHVELAMVDMFKFPTIQSMAHYLQNKDQSREQEIEKMVSIRSRAMKQKTAFNKTKRRIKEGKE